jgi:hypothetical protein
MRALIASTAFALAVGTAGVAAAQTTAPTEPAPASVGTTVPAASTHATGPTLWAILGGWYGGFGLGGRYMLPLNFPPLITQGTVKDSFALEFGADFLTWSYGLPVSGGDYRINSLVPVVGAMWNIWLNDQLALYPKLDIGYQFTWWSGWNGAGNPSHDWLYWNVALGAMYKVKNNIALRGELGYAGLRLGAMFMF